MNQSILRKYHVLEEDISKVMELSLSKGAKVLYAYLFGLPSGSLVCVDELVLKNIVASKAMVNNYKKELVTARLLHENKDGVTNIKFIYLGSTRVYADTFAEDWKRIDV